MSTQPTWNPTQIFDQNKGLKLTSDEIFGIRYNLPRAQDGGFYVDAVFEAFGVLQAMFETMQVARDSHHTRENDLGRIIDIPTGDISATKFDLINVEKDALYLAGYKAAKEFLLGWSWENHLALRGIDFEQWQIAVAQAEATKPAEQESIAIG